MQPAGVVHLHDRLIILGVGVNEAVADAGPEHGIQVWWLNRHLDLLDVAALVTSDSRMIGTSGRYEPAGRCMTGSRPVGLPPPWVGFVLQS